MDLALSGHVDDEVSADRGGAAQSHAPGQRSSPRVAPFDGSRGGEVRGIDADAVLGELAEHRLDLASATDAAATADRVDVDAQLAGGVEHRGTGWNIATESRGREHHEVVCAAHRALFTRSRCRVSGLAAATAAAFAVGADRRVAVGADPGGTVGVVPGEDIGGLDCDLHLLVEWVHDR